jgi:putative proteasome-type protease
LRQVFSEIPEPDWQSAGEVPQNGHIGEMVLYRPPGALHGALRADADRIAAGADVRPAQTLAQADKPKVRG